MSVPITLDSITLPSELLWTDEYAWGTIKNNIKYTLYGKRIIQQSELLGDSGRPITLVGESAWISKADIDSLFAWSKIFEKTMTLTLHNAETYLVQFRHTDSPVLVVSPLLETAYPSSTTLYTIQINLEVL